MSIGSSLECKIKIFETLESLMSLVRYLYSYGTVTQLSGTPFGTVEWNTNTKRLLVYHLFGGLWINAFVIAFAQLVLAGSVAIWFFNVAYDRAHATVG